jgi:hypothetical protein
MLTVKQWKDGFDSDSAYSNDYAPKKEEGMGDIDSKEGNNGDSKEPAKKKDPVATKPKDLDAAK